MRIELRRKLFARILLAVFLPMMALTMLHTHENAGGAYFCEDCVMHVHHNGHFSSTSLSIDNCLVCQFLSLSYTQATLYLLIPFIFHLSESLHQSSDAIHSLSTDNVFLRAPPLFA